MMPVELVRAGRGGCSITKAQPLWPEAVSYAAFDGYMSRLAPAAFAGNFALRGASARPVRVFFPCSAKIPRKPPDEQGWQATSSRTPTRGITFPITLWALRAGAVTIAKGSSFRAGFSSDMRRIPRDHAPGREGRAAFRAERAGAAADAITHLIRNGRPGRWHVRTGSASPPGCGPRSGSGAGERPCPGHRGLPRRSPRRSAPPRPPRLRP